MKKINDVLVILGGLLYLFFGVFHLTFFKIFKSTPDFQHLNTSLLKIVEMLNLGVIVFFVSMGVIILRFRQEIYRSKLGKALLLMSALFFIIRGMAELAFPTFKIAFIGTMVLASLVYLTILIINNKKSANRGF